MGTFANSKDPGEMPYNAPFIRMNGHCLTVYQDENNIQRKKEMSIFGNNNL